VAGYTRKDLKKDKFAEEVKHGFDFLTEHGAQAKLYGGIAVAVILIGAGAYFYIHNQAETREQKLADALRIDNATFGTAPAQPGIIHYATIEDKEKARNQAFNELATKYRGSQEGAIGAFYLASDASDKGDVADAEKRYKDIMDSAPAAYSSMARVSLAEVYESEGKTADAEKLLRYAMDHPTISVSKEEATIQLALLIGKTNPAEGRKMLEPLRDSHRTPVSRAAVQALGEVMNVK
jgi:predicted negative regulator of RcsB-dependent stress response